jgi:1,4-alpha-glucan branching enzyme
VPAEGLYEEVFNTDAATYGGSNLGNAGLVPSQPIKMHGRPNSLSLTLPPLGVAVFKRKG